MQKGHMSACFKEKNILQGNLHFTALGQEGIGFGSILQNTGAALHGIQKVCAVIGLLQIIQGVYVIAVHGVAGGAGGKNNAAGKTIFTERDGSLHAITVRHINIQKEQDRLFYGSCKGCKKIPAGSKRLDGYFCAEVGDCPGQIMGKPHQISLGIIAKVNNHIVILVSN